MAQVTLNAARISEAHSLNRYTTMSYHLLSVIWGRIPDAWRTPSWKRAPQSVRPHPGYGLGSLEGRGGRQAGASALGRPGRRCPLPPGPGTAGPFIVAGRGGPGRAPVAPSPRWAPRAGLRAARPEKRCPRPRRQGEQGAAARTPGSCHRGRPGRLDPGRPRSLHGVPHSPES